MAPSVIGLLSDRERWQRASDAATRAAHARYCDTAIVPLYEAVVPASSSDPSVLNAVKPITRSRYKHSMNGAGSRQAPSTSRMPGSNAV